MKLLDVTRQLNTLGRARLDRNRWNMSFYERSRLGALYRYTFVSASWTTRKIAVSSQWATEENSPAHRK
jgi:hypothetical protein